MLDEHEPHWTDDYDGGDHLVIVGGEFDGEVALLPPGFSEYRVQLEPGGAIIPHMRVGLHFPDSSDAPVQFLIPKGSTPEDCMRWLLACHARDGEPLDG